jgi:hypothetical protein
VTHQPPTDTSTATTSAAAANRMQDSPVEAKQPPPAEIGSTSGKLSAEELADLEEESDDLSTRFMTRHKLEKDAAQREAAAFVDGRVL